MTTATKYKTYSKYKPSGIDWLGDIPAEWEVKRLKYGFYFTKGKNAALYTAEYNAEHAGDYPVYSGQTEGEGVMGSIDSYDYAFERVIFTTTVGAKVMTPLLLSGKFSLSQNCLLMIKSSKQVYEKYFYYQLFPLFNREKSLVPSHMQPSLRFSDLNTFNVAYPEITEQKEIADFLDHETAKIDEMVAKKQKMIDLLKEKRQALITHAVTKGLDPKVKMKPSGIDWLGDIPEGWESWKVAHLFNKIGSGTTPPSDDMDYYEGDIPWVITGELKDNEIFDSENKVTKKAVEELSALKVFPKDSLLIAMYGATIGKMAIIRMPATTNQACCILGGSKIIDTNFSFYFFLAFRPQLIALSYGGGQPNISQDTIKSIKIFLPKIDEQKNIVTFLDRETAKIDEMMKKVEMQIEKLQEYRQALITNAVTGKIKI